MKNITFSRMALTSSMLLIGIIIGISFQAKSQSGVTKAEPIHETIKTRNLEIVDEKGETRGGISFVSKKGCTYLFLTRNDGSPSLMINNPFDTSEQPTIQFAGKKKGYLKIGLTEDEKPIIEYSGNIQSGVNFVTKTK